MLQTSSNTTVVHRLTRLQHNDVIPGGGPVCEVHFRQVFLIFQNIIECGLDVLHNGMELGETLALVQQDVELPSVN